MQPQHYRILIADDQADNIEALRLTFLMIDTAEICGIARSGHELLRQVEILQPDVIITDVHMPHMNGIEATKKLREKGSSPKILALTQYRQEKFIDEMLKAGANGFLMKDATVEELKAAIDTVMNGGLFLCIETGAILHKAYEEDRILLLERKNKTLFSAREIEVLEYLSRGFTAKETAKALGLSKHTVYKYHHNASLKTGKKRKELLALFALNRIGEAKHKLL